MDTKAYMETMNSPLRPEMSVRILITNEDANNPYGNPNKVSIEFTNKDILSLEEYRETDLISRSLPVHTLDFSVLDPGRNLQERYDWETLRCRAYVFYTQMYIPGSQYSRYADAPEKHTFYIKKATTEGQVTKFQCQDVVWILNNYRLSEQVSAEATVPNHGKIIDDIVRYPPPGIKLMTTSLWGREILTLEPYHDTSVAILLQQIMHPLGFIIIDAGNGNYNEKPSNSWRIMFWYENQLAKPDNNSYTLSINNVYKDSIRRITMPSVSEIACTTKSVKVSEHATFLIDVTGERTGDYRPSPDAYVNSYQVVKFNRPLLNVRVYSGADKVRRIEQKTLYECIIYWNLDLDLVKPKPTVVLEGSLIIRNNKMEKLAVPGVPRGTTETLDNPYIDSKTFQNISYKPYIYRNILKMKFRGDFTFYTGYDRIWFEYAPGKKLPCQVISNKIIVKGAMRGELALRILLTDAEIKNLSPSPVSQKAKLTLQDNANTDKSEPFIEEETL